MRVGRISPIKFISYNDVRLLLRGFSLKIVADTSSNQENFSKINRLQPFDSSDLKQLQLTKKALNDMFIDTIEDSELNDINENKNALASKSAVEVMKAMRKARKGNKVNSLELLLKLNANKSILTSSLNTKSDINDTQHSKSITTTDNTRPKKSIDEKNKRVDSLLTEDKKDVQEKKGVKILVEEYAEVLKKIDEEKKSQKKLY